MPPDEESPSAHVLRSGHGFHFKGHRLKTKADIGLIYKKQNSLMRIDPSWTDTNCGGNTLVMSCILTRRSNIKGCHKLTG